MTAPDRDDAAPRSRGMAALVLFVAFFGGGGVGVLLAARMAPGSAVASTIGLLMLPSAMAAGFHAWLGTAVLTAVAAMVRRIVARPPSPPPPTQAVPAGSWAFLPVASFAGAAGGLLTGLLPAAPLTATLTVYWLTGTLYGIALWRLARAGYLPFPDGD